MMLVPRTRDQRPFLLATAALVALAWVALFAWGQSPYDRFLQHDTLAEIEFGEGAGYAGLLAVFVGGWTVMTVAMMLPTSLPLITLFERMVRRREASGVLVGLLIAGYLVAWSGFGVLAHAGDVALHLSVERAGWLDGNAWIIGAGTLLLAGGYQFTALKYRCLDKCRSPYTFIAERWSGDHEVSRSFRLGIEHGIFCVGCCWSLMLLMFAVGVGNVGWMLVLGAIMAVEKNASWGRRLSSPLGVMLLAGGSALVIGNLLG